jgi:hypothetical protein
MSMTGEYATTASASQGHMLLGSRLNSASHKGAALSQQLAAPVRVPPLFPLASVFASVSTFFRVRLSSP